MSPEQIARVAGREAAQFIIGEGALRGIKATAQIIHVQKELAKHGFKTAMQHLTTTVTEKASQAANRIAQALPKAGESIEIATAGTEGVFKTTIKNPGVAEACENIAKNPPKMEMVKNAGKAGAKTSLKITDATARKIWAESQELKQLEKVINDLNQVTNNERLGSILHKVKSIKEYQKIESLAEDIYAGIRQSSSDVTQIAKNTGISEDIIQQIKQHVFMEGHVLNDGIKRFPADFDIAKSWQRLIDGKFVQSDLQLLKHEFAESLLMKGTNVEWRIGHDLANGFCNWHESL